MAIEPLLRGVHRDMWAIESDPEEKGLIVVTLKSFDGPIGGDFIGHLIIGIRVDAPVPEWVAVRLRYFFLWAWAESAIAATVILKELSIVAVEDLTDGHGAIAVRRKVLRQRRDSFEIGRLGEGRTEKIDAGRMGISSGQETRTRGITDGGLTMGVGKQSAPSSESIDVRCECLRMSAQASDPIVEVVDGDEKNVGA